MRRRIGQELHYRRLYRAEKAKVRRMTGLLAAASERDAETAALVGDLTRRLHDARALANWRELG